MDLEFEEDSFGMILLLYSPHFIGYLTARALNPEKYKALLERYFAKKKSRLEAEKAKAEAKKQKKNKVRE